MIPITDDIAIDESEIQEKFIRSPGPGGQNVNKTSTAVQLRFDVRSSPSLPDDVRARLLHLAGKRITEEGVLVIESGQFRSQGRNRQDARKRLVQWIRKAVVKPKSRKKTKPTLASKQRRLASKRRRSEIKKIRRSVPPRED